MSLQVQIKDEIKKAMLAKDQVRLLVMRNISSSFTNELVAKGRKPQEELPDDEATAVIRRLVKQRKDSIDQFEKGGRADLAADEQAELTILETLLPNMMSKEDIKKIAEVKKVELGITDKASAGKLIGAIAKDLKGKADGMDIKEVVEGLF